MTWRIVSQFIIITVAGGLAHLLDFPIRIHVRSSRMKLLLRYGLGAALVFPAFLSRLEMLLAGSPVEKHASGRVLQLASAAYLQAFGAFGVGVVMGHLLEQMLMGDGE